MSALRKGYGRPIRLRLAALRDLRLRFLSGSELPRQLDVAPPALTRLKRLVGVLSQDARMKSIVKKS